MVPRFQRDGQTLLAGRRRARRGRAVGLPREFRSHTSKRNLICPIKASPLFDRFRPGDLITHLDDVFLGGPNDLWTSYLSSDEVLDDGQGLCVHKDYYTRTPASSTSILKEDANGGSETTPRRLAMKMLAKSPSYQSIPTWPRRPQAAVYRPVHYQVPGSLVVRVMIPTRFAFTHWPSSAHCG